MAGGGGSVASARARGKRLGRVYKGAGGRLRDCGVNHVTGACAAWAARRCDVRRSGGQWRAAVGTPASRNWPPGAVQTLAIVTNSGTPGATHGPLGPLGPLVPRCARGVRTAAGVARVRDVARGRALAFPGENSSLKLLSNWFFSKFSN
jgi:hypothetical protein